MKDVRTTAELVEGILGEGAEEYGHAMMAMYERGMLDKEIAWELFGSDEKKYTLRVCRWRNSRGLPAHGRRGGCTRKKQAAEQRPATEREPKRAQEAGTGPTALRRAVIVLATAPDEEYRRAVEALEKLRSI